MSEMPFKEEKALDFIESSIKQLFSAVRDKFLIPPTLITDDPDKEYVERIKEDMGAQVEGSWRAINGKIWFNPYLNIIFASPEYIYYKGLKYGIEKYAKNASTEELEDLMYSAVLGYCAVYFYAAMYMKSPLDVEMVFLSDTKNKLVKFFGEDNINFNFQDPPYDIVGVYISLAGSTFPNDGTFDLTNYACSHLVEGEPTFEKPSEYYFTMNYIGIKLGNPYAFRALTMGKRIVIHLAKYNGDYMKVSMFEPDFEEGWFKPDKEFMLKVYEIQTKTPGPYNIFSSINMNREKNNSTITIEYIICPSWSTPPTELANEYLVDVKSYTDKVRKPILDTVFVNYAQNHNDVTKKFISLVEVGYPEISAFIYSNSKQYSLEFGKYNKMSKEAILYNFVVYTQVAIIGSNFVFDSSNDHLAMVRRGVFENILDKADIKNEMYNRELCLDIANYFTQEACYIFIEDDEHPKKTKAYADLIFNSQREESVALVMELAGVDVLEYNTERRKYDGEMITSYCVYWGGDKEHLYDTAAEVDWSDGFLVEPVSYDIFILYATLKSADKFVVVDPTTGDYMAGIAMDICYRTMKELFESER